MRIKRHGKNLLTLREAFHTVAALMMNLTNNSALVVVVS
jgi:hypothetical protein